MERIYILLNVLLLFTLNVSAQNSYELKFIDEEAVHFQTKEDYLAHKKAYFSKLAEFKIPINPNYFYQYEIDLKSIEKYKRLGVDVVGLGHRYGKLHFSDYLVTSDIIIEGTVVKEEFFPEPSDYFHTKYTIKLTGEDYLTNGVSEFYVYSTSGPIDDSFQTFSHEVLPVLDEKAIFFLRRDNVSELNEAYKDNLLPSRVRNINVDRSSSAYYLAYKVKEKDGKLYDQDNILVGKASKIIRTLKKVIKFRKRIDFYEVDFK